MKETLKTDRLYRSEDSIKIWCDCGDRMEHNASDRVQKHYGKAMKCIGCQKTVYIDISEEVT